MRATPKFDLVFDVVVVGAGCVVAARLAEKANTDVCLIEAGDQVRIRWDSARRR
jgi:choline dehydrogenase-like flavoprotein